MQEAVRFVTFVEISTIISPVYLYHSYLPSCPVLGDYCLRFLCKRERDLEGRTLIRLAFDLDLSEMRFYDIPCNG